MIETKKKAPTEAELRDQALNTIGLGELELADRYNQEHGTTLPAPLPKALLKEAIAMVYSDREALKRR
jgi:hypothetical protein